MVAPAEPDPGMISFSLSLSVQVAKGSTIPTVVLRESKEPGTDLSVL